MPICPYLWLCSLIVVLIVFFFLLFFLNRNNSLENFFILECSIVPLGFLLLNGSPSKESNGAFLYLRSFTIVLRIFLIMDLLTIELNLINLRLRLILGLGVLTFFSKLPIFFLHQWLPKAHVECITIGSVLLARFLLKFGLPSLRGRLIFIFIGCFVCLLGQLNMLSTCDFKIWVAFSSITHMSLFFTGLHVSLYDAVYYYFIVHTLLSSMMFYFFSNNYGLMGSRNYFYFGLYVNLFIVFHWLRIPTIITFLRELLILLFMFNNFFNFLLLFFIMFLFLFISSVYVLNGCTLSSRHLREVLVLSNSSLRSVIFSLFIVLGWIFL